jgi:hypothetical protein
MRNCRANDVDAQAAADRRVVGRQRLLGVADLFEDRDAPLVIGGAVGGHGHPSRRPVQQPDPQIGFQVPDGGRDRRLGHREALRGAGKPARIDDPRERFHGLQFVHCSKS